MNENEKKNAIVKAMTEVECITVFEPKEEIDVYDKLSVENLVSLGAIASSIKPVIQGLKKTKELNETLYKMVIPKHIKGKFSVDELGNIRTPKSKGQIEGRARFKKFGKVKESSIASINPTIMLMAIAVASINKKLDEIQETQKEILEFLQLKEKAKLKGNLSVLQEILDEYKYNWNNEKFKNNKHIQVQEIKRDSEQSVVFCREMIEKKASKNVGFIHSDGSVKSKIQKIQSEFKDYELALYLYAFSSFLEVMLLENFDNGYLNSVSSKIELYANQCNDLYKIALEKV